MCMQHVIKTLLGIKEKTGKNVHVFVMETIHPQKGTFLSSKFFVYFQYLKISQSTGLKCLISPTADNPEQSLLHTVTAPTINPVLLICLMTNDAVIKVQRRMWFHCSQDSLGSDFIWKGWRANVYSQNLWETLFCSI